MEKPLPRSFYARDAIHLAPALIGKILLRRIGGRTRRARIVETEAYIGEHDLACHASKGRTNRTEIMFGPPGHAYVYFIYGMHHMLNIVAAGEDDAQAVLIRAAEPLDGWDVNLTGPGRLARGLELTRAHNGVDLTRGELVLTGDPDAAKPPRVTRSKRIGVDYAGHWKHRLLRFHDANSRAVSKG